MILSSIVAMGKNRVIGKDNQMMWSIPSEYDFYRKKRANHFFIIGRKNYDGSKELHHNEKAIILTRQKNYSCDHPCFNHLRDAVAYGKEQGETELFIIGGSEIYELAMPYIERLYLSIVDFDEEGDAFFPRHEDYDWKVLESWQKLRRGEGDEETPLEWEFTLLEKTPQPLGF